MHQCPACPKAFPSPYKLQRHYVIHTGQKPFICRVCGKAFTQSEHLKTHLKKVHHSRLPTDRLQDGSLTHNHQPSCDKPAAGTNTCVSSNCTAVPSTATSSVASQSEWKWEYGTQKKFLPSSEIKNPLKIMPHVSAGSVAQIGISDVVDPIPQKQVDSANVDASVCNAHDGYTCKVCLKSFTSCLQLLIHSPTHNKPKPLERGRDLGQTFSKKARLKVHLQPQELSSSKITVQHQCPKCLKTFCSPSKLQRHFLIHTGQKPYLCMICCKAFRQKVHLKSHLSTANKCSLAAGTERKKTRFSESRKTSGLQPPPSLQQRPTCHRTPVDSSVELELHCKISVNAVQDLSKAEIKGVKPEQLLNTSDQCQSICHKSEEPWQRHLTRQDLKRFQCVNCNRSFRFESNLMRHHEIHRNQKELGSPTTVQHSNNVKMPDSEAMKHLPAEPVHADPIDLNIIVKADTWSENCCNHNDSLPPESELITSAEQQRETCHSTCKRQRIKALHQCQTCLKCFPSVSKLQRHMMTHTGQRPFRCEVCGKRFRQETHLRVHCRTHLWSRYHKQRSLYVSQPPSCLGGFNTKTAAQASAQEACEKDFETHPGSDVVSVKHLDPTPVSVFIQHDNRESDRSLPHASKKNKVHFRKVSRVTVKRTQAAKFMQNPGSLQHKCSQCLKCFPSASKLQRHEMVHTGLKPFQCPVCGKAFRQAPHLKTHERTHRERKPPKPANQQSTANPKSNGTCQKRKPHTCRICFKNFVFPYKLSRHMVTHSGMRPYKCSSCSKSFTQRGHLNRHQHRCRQDNRVSHYLQGEMINTNYVQDKCIESLDCADLNVDARRELPEPHYTSVGHYSFTDGDLSFCSGAIGAEWLTVPEVSSQEENNEWENSYSFPSELAFEINKLVRDQNLAAPPLSHQYEGDAHNVEVPCQPEGVSAMSESNSLLSDEPVSSVVGNQMIPDNSWCEPLTVFECDKCTSSFTSKVDLKRHVCSTEVQTKKTQKNRCNICLKYFVSPSKLKRHYVIHTGQRPFSCDICGKTFTQSAHVRTHRLTH